MSTPTALVNVALRRVGATRINDLEADGHKEAVVARDIYTHCRKTLLNKHTWNFSIRRAQLTESATAPAFGWDNAFIIPDDFLRVVSVHPVDDDYATIPYRLANQSSDDRVIETNATTCYLRYVFDLMDVALMPAAFQDVFALCLAKELGAGLSKPRTLIADIADEIRRELPRAKSIDGVEDFAEPMAEGSWVTDRGMDTAWDDGNS